MFVYVVFILFYVCVCIRVLLVGWLLWLLVGAWAWQCFACRFICSLLPLLKVSLPLRQVSRLIVALGGALCRLFGGHGCGKVLRGMAVKRHCYVVKSFVRQLKWHTSHSSLKR